MSQARADIAMVGLAVMGRNLALNMSDHGFTVAVWNYETEWTDAFVRDEAAGRDIIGAHTLEELVASLKRPRRIMMMIRAGSPVDQVIAQLIPLLEPGDILIDGGNSNWQDTERRRKEVESMGLLYVGTGVSGGEEGARNGPSLMPGGSPEAWPHVRDVFQAIAAKVDGGTPCCDWVGEGGAGHYVKMVHNGIEYGDMQLICEAYDLMRRGLGLSYPDLESVFGRWNEGVLDSYLIEITRDVMGVMDADGEPLVEKILDTAGQKGTGQWTVRSSLELGIPVTLIAEAVYARSLSALKDERVRASKVLQGPSPATGRGTDFIDRIEGALYASKIVSYAQGFMLMREAAKEQGWNLNYGGIALMWRGGCIIRSRFLGNIHEAFSRQPDLDNLLVVDFFREAIEQNQQAWRDVVAEAVRVGIPVPAMSSALAFYDGYRTARLPANLLQAQRDYFGAHTYERVDRARGEFFHTEWK
ncbi:MAG TPA: decarboxylating NADP(+)-dependent phosphogluconate dehydrogenase [Rhodothermales bacterium]